MHERSCPQPQGGVFKCKGLAPLIPQTADGKGLALQRAGEQESEGTALLCCTTQRWHARGRAHVCTASVQDGRGNLGLTEAPSALDVIHTVGPIAVGQPSASQAAELRSCYLSSLDLLLEHRLRSVVRVARRRGAGVAREASSDPVSMSSHCPFPRLSRASPQACLVSLEKPGLAWAVRAPLTEVGGAGPDLPSPDPALRIPQRGGSGSCAGRAAGVAGAAQRQGEAEPPGHLVLDGCGQWVPALPRPTPSVGLCCGTAMGRGERAA